VKRLDPGVPGELLGPVEVLDSDEGVVGHLEADPRGLEAAGQAAVTVEVELESKRRPGWHARLAQAELGIEEVDVVVEALRVPGTQGCLARRLVVLASILFT